MKVNKEAVLSVRVTIEDRDKIASRALEAGMSQSEYIVACALGHNPLKSPRTFRLLDELEAAVRRLEEPGRGWIPS